MLGLQNASLQALHGATQLTWLHISAASKVTDAGLQYLAKHTQLQFLAACDLVSVTSAGWQVSMTSAPMPGMLCKSLTSTKETELFWLYHSAACSLMHTPCCHVHHL